MSRIIQFAIPGGPEVLTYKDVDVPAPAAGEVRIRVKAIGLNRAESTGYTIWNTSGDPERQKAAVDFILGGLASGALKPVIDKTFEFDEMVEAHRYLEGNRQFGKIVVTV